MTAADPVWFAVESLGATRHAPALVRGWLDRLVARPGEELLLEQGELQARPFLRVRAREGLLAPAATLQAAAAPVRLRSAAPGSCPPDPGMARAFGRVIWTGPIGGNVEGGSPRGLDVAPSVGHPPPSLLLPDGGSWMVQGFFRGRPGPGGLVCHVRLAVEAPPAGLTEVRDRVGLAWAAALGARFEGWAPGSRAHQVALVEWDRRVVVRCHSGSATPPPTPVLGSVWSVPPYRSGTLSPVAAGPLPPDRPGGALHLGEVWGRVAECWLPLPSLLRHVAVVGMTGSGKTQLLAHLAAEASRERIPFVLFDLHGDLGPATLGRIDPPRRAEVVVLDATRLPADGLVGVDVLGGHPDDLPPSELESDLLASEMLSALRPIGSGKEEFWGPRIERFLESGIRAVLSSRGTLYDVAELLQDPLRRAEELAHQPQSAPVRRFLEELPGLVRRQPDLLASSQNRLSKVLLSRTVQQLVAPAQGGLELERELDEGRSLILHLPKGRLGESTSGFVANVLLARVFLGLLRGHAEGGRQVPRALLVLDEAQAYSPRLLRALVEEGRKFGAACLIATQSPGRLSELFGGAPVGAVGTLIALRCSPEDARTLPPTLLGETDPRGRTSDPSHGVLAFEGMVQSLTTLPPHAAWVRKEGDPAPELLRLPAPRASDLPAWEERATASAAMYGRRSSLPAPEATGTSWEEEALGAVLLRAAQAEAHGRAIDLSEERPTGPFQAGRSRWAMEEAYAAARRRRYVVEHGPEGSPPCVELTPAGWSRLGYVEHGGALRESTEHRRLLREAFRLLALRGVVLELPEQGRMDRRTPDARLALRTVLGLPSNAAPAEELEAFSTARDHWLWRLGHGRDLYVEAEVSKAGDSERLERCWQKAKSAGAFLVLLTGSSEGGRRIRRWLRAEGIGSDRAVLWVLRPGVLAAGHRTPLRTGAMDAKGGPRGDGERTGAGGGDGAVGGVPAIAPRGEDRAPPG